MCDDGTAGTHTQRGGGQVLYDFEPSVVFDLEPVDSVTVTTLMDNVTDALMVDQGTAHRPLLFAGGRRPATTMEGGDVPDALVAEHGFSVLVDVSKDGTRHTVLFDTGTSPTAWPRTCGGCKSTSRGSRSSSAATATSTTPPGSMASFAGWGPSTSRCSSIRTSGAGAAFAIPGRDPLGIPTTSRRALVDAGFEVIEEQQPSFLFDRSLLLTGEVPRTTGYEPGLPPQQAWLGGRWEPDPLVLDDQALIVDIKGKGLLVITGCGHAGVINICRYARRLTKDRPLYTVMGGFHLNGPAFEPLIPRVLDDMSALSPSVVVPAHCTGWRAQHALSNRFGEAFIPNTGRDSGSSFERRWPGHREKEMQQWSQPTNSTKPCSGRSCPKMSIGSRLRPSPFSSPGRRCR